TGAWRNGSRRRLKITRRRYGELSSYRAVAVLTASYQTRICRMLRICRCELQQFWPDQNTNQNITPSRLPIAAGADSCHTHRPARLDDWPMWRPWPILTESLYGPRFGDACCRQDSLWCATAPATATREVFRRQGHWPALRPMRASDHGGRA